MRFESHDWDATSMFMTPRTFKKSLTVIDGSSLETLNRCRTSVMRNIFSSVIPMVDTMKISLSNERILKHLMNEGYIPSVNKCVRRVTNSFYGYVNSDNKWVELCLPSIEVVRAYWQLLLETVVTNQDNIFVDTFQCILSLYPRIHTSSCLLCNMNVPGDSMHDDTHCCYCNDSKSNTVHLKSNFGSPYIHLIPLVECR